MTRFYLPSTGEAAVSPAFSSWWENTTPAERHAAVTTRIGSANFGVDIPNGAVTGDVLLRQYVSEALAAQTITAQTLKIQARGWSYAVARLLLSWSVRVVSNDGGTVRGILIEQRDGLAFPSGASYVNRRDYGTCAQVVAQAGDRIVIEVGAYKPVYYGGVVKVGDDNATDLPENDTETTAYNPWLEFSQTLLFDQPLHFEPVVVSAAFPPFSMAPGPLTLHFTPVAVATAFPAFSITGSHVAERLGQLLSSEPVRFDKGTGAPVHTAPKGTPYWRQDNNTFYVNSDGATGWTQIGGGSGMADHGNEYHTPDFEAEGVAAGLVTTHVAAANPHPAYASNAGIIPFGFNLAGQAFNPTAG